MNLLAVLLLAAVSLPVFASSEAEEPAPAAFQEEHVPDDERIVPMEEAVTEKDAARDEEEETAEIVNDEEAPGKPIYKPKEPVSEL
jgi:hypothetical protein